MPPRPMGPMRPGREHHARPWRRRAVLAGGVLLAVAWTKGVPFLIGLRRADEVFGDLPGLLPFGSLTLHDRVSVGDIFKAHATAAHCCRGNCAETRLGVGCHQVGSWRRIP